jgi:hypothetical protein
VRTFAILWTHHSEQYRKAWFASFPPDLWPAVEEETDDGRTILRLKDGSTLLALSQLGRPEHELVEAKEAIVRGHDLKFLKEALAELDPAMKGCEDDPGYRTQWSFSLPWSWDQMWMHFHVSRGTRRTLLEKLPAAQLRLDCGRRTMSVATTGSLMMAKSDA